MREQYNSGQTTKCLSIYHVYRIIGLSGDRVVWSINDNVYTNRSVIQPHVEVLMF